MDTKQFEKEVRSVLQKCKSNLDKPNDPLARQLIDSLQKLEDDVQCGKSVETLKAQLKSMRSMAQRVEDSGVMSYNEADMLKDWVEDALRKVR